MATYLEKKLLRVLVSANSTEKIPILAATYEELVAECKRKLPHDGGGKPFDLYTEDNTKIDEDFFTRIGDDIIVRLSTEASLVFPSIVFKVNSKNGLYQIGERNLMVTVNLSDKYTSFMDDFNNKIEGDEEIFSLEWLRWEDHAKVFSCGLKTQVTNALHEHLCTIEHIILKYIGKEDFKVLRSLTEKFFVEFKAMMSAVFQGCLDFRFNFLSADERMVMMQDLPKVQSILNRMLFPPDFEKDYPGVHLTTTINHEYTSDGDTSTQSSIESRIIQYLYQTEGDTVAVNLRSLEGELLPNASLNSIYSVLRNFSATTSSAIQQSERILYTVLCVDKSSSLSVAEFSSIKKCAIEFFKELDRNAHSELHLEQNVNSDPYGKPYPDINVNRNEHREPHLDENVAILGFGDSLEYLSGFSFKIQDQIALMDQMEKGTVQSSGSLQVLEAVVTANFLLKEHGKRRNFGNGEEFLPPRVVLISGSGFPDVPESGVKQLIDRLGDKDMRYPVYCFNIRSSSNQDRLSFLTTHTNGKLITKSKSYLLGAFHRLKMRKTLSQNKKKEDSVESQDIEFLFG